MAAARHIHTIAP